MSSNWSSCLSGRIRSSMARSPSRSSRCRKWWTVRRETMLLWRRSALRMSLQSNRWRRQSYSNSSLLATPRYNTRRSSRLRATRHCMGTRLYRIAKTALSRDMVRISTPRWVSHIKVQVWTKKRVEACSAHRQRLSYTTRWCRSTCIARYSMEAI